MLKKVWLITCLLLISLNYAFALSGNTDSSTQSPKFKFGFELAHYYQTEPSYGVPYIYLPTLLPERRQTQKNLRNTWELNNAIQGTDNPLYHGAGYFTLHSRWDVDEHFYALASITGELRGESYGMFNTKNTFMFPQYRLCYEDTLLINKKRLIYKAQLGNFNNIRFAEGLMLYNIDVQALRLNISYRRFSFDMIYVGDLFESIGLNVDDAWHSFVYYTTPKYKKYGYLKLGAGFCYNKSVPNEPPFTTIPKNTIDLSASYVLKKKLKVYTQISNRTQYTTNTLQSYAGVIGASKDYQDDMVKIIAHVEYRFYGSNYKQGFNNQDVYYRATTAGQYGGNYGNTIGNNLYPMRNFERPFSQFAVFTEYTNLAVNCYTAYADGIFKLYNKLSAQVTFDANILSINYFDGKSFTQSNFAYPFYKAGFRLDLARNTMMFVGISNKGMNLDNTYQTFYLYQRPVIEFRFLTLLNQGGFIER